MRIFSYCIYFSFWLFVLSCGQGTVTKSSSGDEIFDLTIVNSGQDTLHQYGIDLDLVRVEEPFSLRIGDREIPVQIEDRNHNGTPDKMYTLVDLGPGTTELVAYTGGGAEIPEGVRVHANLIDGKKVTGKHLVNFGEKWVGNGIIMENEWVGFRTMSIAPYAIDIIGKRKPDLLESPLNVDLQTVSNWGGDAFDEGLSLGIGSPAIFDLANIVPLTKYDSKEIEVIQTGPLRAEVHTTIKGVPVRDEKIDILIKWQMQAGKHWSQLNVSIISKTDLNLQFAFGLPKHDQATDFTQGFTDNVHFAYTYGLQSSENEQLGMAIMVPGQYEMDTYRDDPHNYFYLATPINQAVEYRIMNAWVKDRLAIYDEVAFLDLVRKYVAEYGAKVTIKPDFRL